MNKYGLGDGMEGMSREYAEHCLKNPEKVPQNDYLRALRIQATIKGISMQKKEKTRKKNAKYKVDTRTLQDKTPRFLERINDAVSRIKAANREVSLSQVATYISARFSLSYVAASVYASAIYNNQEKLGVMVRKHIQNAEGSI